MLLAGLLALTGCGPAAPDPSGSPGFADAANAAVTTVLADLEDYWTATQPIIGGPAFVPPAGGYHPVDAAAGGAGALCVTSPAQITGNAFYCPDQDGLVWDTSALVPVLWSRGGAGAVAAAFAHEYGHAVQARVGPTPAQRSTDPVRYPTLLVEAQADCYAGAFLAWLRDGGSTRERMDTADLLPSLQVVLDFRDPAGMVAVDPAAHGRGVDRLEFVLRGWGSGAAACRALTTTDLPLDRRTENGGRPRYADPAGAVADAAPSLRRLVTGWPDGSGTMGDPPSPDPADLDAARPFGQFAAAAAAALATGHAVTGSDIGAACFAGAWTAAVTSAPTTGGLGAWAGDPDEALDLVRSRPGATTDQLVAFAAGWQRGPDGCR